MATFNTTKLCEACGKHLEHKNDVVRHKQYFESVLDMFEKGIIKQWLLLPSDAEKLRLLLDNLKK